FDVVGVKRLGDEKGRLRARSGQQQLRVSRHEDDRQGDGAKDLVDGVEPGAAVGKVNVGQHQAGPQALDRLDRLPFGADDLDDAVAELGDQALKVEGNQRLVFDDDDVGRHLPSDLTTRLVDETLQFACADVEDPRGVLRRELLNGYQQERLPRPRRQRVEVALDGVKTRMGWALGGFSVVGDGIYNLQESPVEGEAGRQVACKQRRVGENCLQGGDHIRIAAFLRAGDGARKSPQIRQVFCNLLANRHNFPS